MLEPTQSRRDEAIYGIVRAEIDRYEDHAVTRHGAAANVVENLAAGGYLLPGPTVLSTVCAVCGGATAVPGGMTADAFRDIAEGIRLAHYDNNDIADQLDAWASALDTSTESHGRRLSALRWDWVRRVLGAAPPTIRSGDRVAREP